VDAELIASSGGIFDVVVDGTLLYSKHETGRHIRDDAEVIELIKQLQES